MLTNPCQVPLKPASHFETGFGPPKRSPAAHYRLSARSVPSGVRRNRYEAHLRPPDGFSVNVVALIRLHVRLDILRRHQPHLVTLLSQSPPWKVRPSTGFHANQLDLQTRRECSSCLRPNRDSNSIRAARSDCHEIVMVARSERIISKQNGSNRPSCKTLGRGIEWKILLTVQNPTFVLLNRCTWLTSWSVFEARPMGCPRFKRLPLSLTGVFAQHPRPCRPYPSKIRDYRSFRQSERETAAYHLLMWLRTAVQWCW